jgi:uncharacterized membrane protein
MAAAAEVVASWSRLIIIFGVMRGVRAIFYTVMHVNKKRMMNKNLNSFIRNFLVFEKYLLMPS